MDCFNLINMTIFAYRIKFQTVIMIPITKSGIIKRNWCRSQILPSPTITPLGELVNMTICRGTINLIGTIIIRITNVDVS